MLPNIIAFSALLALSSATLSPKALGLRAGAHLFSRQGSDCSSAGLLVCENGCIPPSYICCDDGSSTGCPTGTTCNPDGCCPTGEECSGGGGTDTFTFGVTATSTVDDAPPDTGFGTATLTPTFSPFESPSAEPTPVNAFPTANPFASPTGSTSPEATATENPFSSPSDFTASEATPSPTTGTVASATPKKAAAAAIDLPAVQEQVLALVAAGLLLL